MSVPVLTDAWRSLSKAPLLAVTVMRDNSCNKDDDVGAAAVVLAYRAVVVVVAVLLRLFAVVGKE